MSYYALLIQHYLILFLQSSPILLNILHSKKHLPSNVSLCFMSFISQFIEKYIHHTFFIYIIIMERIIYKAAHQLSGAER